MFKLTGYRPSNGAIKCSTFSASSLTKSAVSANSTYIIPEHTPVSDQGFLSSCAANATADALEILKGLEDPTKVEQVSRLFIYYNARAAQHETNKDEGCYIHDALASLTKLGVCRESTWQYDTNNVFLKPPIEAYREGNDNSITDFYQITSTGTSRLADVEKAIRANHPVIFGTQVSQEFLDYRYKPEQVFNPPSNSTGGHAMLITGVRRNSDGSRDFWVRNSWSENTWGIKGHVWLSDKYIMWNQTNDLFVPTLMIDFTV